MKNLFDFIAHLFGCHSSFHYSPKLCFGIEKSKNLCCYSRRELTIAHHHTLYGTLAGLCQTESSRTEPQLTELKAKLFLLGPKPLWCWTLQFGNLSGPICICWLCAGDWAAVYTIVPLCIRANELDFFRILSLVSGIRLAMKPWSSGAVE